MKFTFETELGNDAMLFAHNVKDALELSMKTVLQHRANLPLKSGQHGVITDLDGNIVGKWEVTDTPADPIERMYAEAFAESTATHGTVCSEDEIAEDIAALTPEDRAEWNKLPTPPDTAREAFELIVRWGRPDEEDEPREAKVYTFETEAERNAYRDGIIEAQPDTTRFDFYTRNANGTIPDDEEWKTLYGESEK